MAKANINTSKEVWPVCYAYTTPEIPKHDGWTKIGITERDAETRIKEQVNTVDVDPKIEWVNNAIYEGSSETFLDTDFHKYLVNLGIEKIPNKEWFKIEPNDAEIKFFKFRKNRGLIESYKEPAPYDLRNEQKEAVNMTMEYFKNHKDSEFLWNAKPRFGKTLSSYDLCLKMNFKNILIVTNRPAIANSWYDDYVKFVGPNSGYIFVSHVEGIKDKKYIYSRKEFIDILPKVENYKGCIQFVSLQDLKGSLYFGGDIDKLEEVYDTMWDILIIDEAHEGVDTFKTHTAFNQISRKNTLHLSGTPFKALANEKFPDDAIYNWTYRDEQKAKDQWDDKLGENPYKNLPKLNLFTYKMSDIVIDEIEEGIDIDGENYEYAFDLNEFFKTDGKCAFIHNDEVDIFLDSLTDPNKSQFPFSTENLREEIKHLFWILNRVDSAKALKRKLEVNPVFKDYEIVLAAGDGTTDDEVISEESFKRVRDAIKKFEKTITLSVGQLTTGVTIPEWTAVLILSNMKSPSLYMQAAFRSQNPCLFYKKDKENVHYLRKKNAYVFDFDPARSLDIFEQFANNLSPYTSGKKGDSELKKKQVKELLNYFPVYSEDEDGEMILLDAEKVLSIPRKIKSVEVVRRGFMSNFLFENISNIFRAPAQVREIIEKFTPVKESKRNHIPVDDDTADELDINENGEVEIPDDKINNKAKEIFGDKIYRNIEEDLDEQVLNLSDSKDNEKDNLENIIKPYTEIFTKSITEPSKKFYEEGISRSTEKKIEKNIEDKVSSYVTNSYNDYDVEKNKLNFNKEKELENSKSSKESSEIEKKYDDLNNKNFEEFNKKVREKFDEYKVIDDFTKQSVNIIETDKKEKEKKTKEDKIRDNLRGFSRTIPSFLMAYGDYNTKLENFDEIIPNNVFKEVTSISIEEFKGLRDGFEYINENGEKVKYEGSLFNEIVFNDSVKEFLNKKNELKNYFDEENKRDIFDYIPPQKTNQIFTPKKVVKKMVNLLEKENPDCFENPDYTFLDPYMKSGLYIAEIVKRLYKSEKLKSFYPNKKDRLNHIFAKQVYGLAPTEIIYRIACNFVLGFSDDIKIEKHNLKLLDSLESIKEDRFEEDLESLYPEFRED